MATAQLNLQNVQHDAGKHQHLYDLANRFYRDASQQGNQLLLDDATQLAELAWQQKPEYLPGINLLARIALQQDKLSKAWEWIGLGLSKKPDSINLLYSAGLTALAEHDLDKAEEYFTAAYRISRVATKAANYLAHIALLKKDYLLAFQYYRELIKTQADDEQVKAGLFSAAEQLSADFYSDELEQDLLRYFEFSDVDHSQLRSLTTSLLKHKLHLSEAGCPLELESLASDPLLLAALEKFYFCDPLIEKLLVTLRQSIFISSSAKLAIESQLIPLASALAWQTYLNESIWYQTEQEQKLIGQLETLISRMMVMPDLDNHDIYPILLLVFMYQAPQLCSFANQLNHEAVAWPITIGPLIEQAMIASRTLEQHRQQLTRFGNSNNQVSAKVSEQYNQNPYPRWVDIGYSQPSDYCQALIQNFPDQLQHLSLPVPTQVLVAGCGTGRHALRLARYFYHMQVTAVDLSEQALAYASSKAQQYQINNIEFLQGDLLLGERLGQQFDVIECSGVLHHMENPAAGLRAVVKQLKPGGLLKIALYSSAARRCIQQLREQLADHLPETAHDMRLIREALLKGSLGSEWNTVISSPDFYSLSACRDLLFHQQEHTYNCDELQQLIDGEELEFIGMIPQGESEKLSQALFNKPGHQLTLSEWGELEKEKPDLFAGMYQFYVRKAF
ncbi:methyltransferase domain-containing protein [Bacterioplanoides sp.]|uniref:methyltransferase domain-containing protein n=1 Tax=Bacterioplanoides sp. TaxID=2066072 RepID=UPI003B003F19